MKRCNVDNLASVHRRPADSGLTLVELLIALVLMAFVLGATWTLMGVFRDRLETSQHLTEQWQLTRSLQQVLSDDLRSCQIPAAAKAVPAESRDTRQTGSTTSDAGAPPASGEGNRAAEADVADLSPRQLDEPSGAATGASLDGTLSATDIIVRSQWLAAESVLLGTPSALMFDVIPPAAHQPPPPVAQQRQFAQQQPLTPEQPQALDVEPSLEQAAIPDTLRRVVYVFHDRDTAIRLGRPAGLIRCELTMRQLTLLRELGSGGLDLMTLLQNELPEWQRADRTSGRAANSPADSNTLDTRPVDLPVVDEGRVATALPIIGGKDLQLGRHLDYIPEVARFLLRYYDGSTWHTQWDSRHSGQRPVAIELRFQLEDELPAEDTDRDGHSEEQTTPDDFGASESSLLVESSPARLGPVDDRLRSAQTRPPEDHRLLVFLRSRANGDRQDTSESPTDSAFGSSLLDRASAGVFP
jgi:hypothetical protein